MTEPAPRQRRKRAPRFDEVAARSGVSIATVDRVLNERDSVSDKTRRKVLAAAADLGLPRILPDPDHGLVHVDLLLPRNETPFFQRLGNAFRDASALLDRRVVVHRRILAETDLAAMIAGIRNPPYRRAGFIFAAPDEPGIRAAVTEALARGECGVAAVTELPGLPGLAYCGIDNRQGGMVAADMMGRMLPLGGRVAVLTTSLVYRAHRDRVEGFREVAAQHPQLTLRLIETETRDDPERCHHALRRALAEVGPLAGIYYTGAGSDGIARALTGLTGPQPVWIGHEASDDHIGLLRQDRMQLAIDQDPKGQAFAALQTVVQSLGLASARKAEAKAELRLISRYNCG